MACQFTLGEVVGLLPPGGSDPIEIIASGGFDLTAGEKPCENVTVGITIGGEFMTGETPVDPDTAQWSITFTAGVDYDAGNIVCDADLKIDLACAGSDDSCPSTSIGSALNCRARDCPSEVELQLVKEDGDPVPTEQECVEPGTYHVEVVSPINPGNVYQWSIDGGSFDSSPTNQPHSPTFQVEGDGSALSVGITIVVTSIPGCVVGDTLAIPTCLVPGDDCPTSLDIEIIDDAGDPVLVDDENGDPVPAGTEGTCIPPGTYRGRVPSIAPDALHDWSITGVDFGPGPENENVSPTFPLQESDSVALSVSVVSFSLACLPSVDPVLLDVCERAVDCGNLDSLTVEVDPPDGIGPDDCLPPGQYVARVTDPADTTGLTFSWSRDGELIQASLDPANYPLGGPELLFELAAGETAELTAATQVAAGCPLLSDGTEVVGCDCPQLVLEIIDGDGNTVDTSQCVDAGRYTARVQGAIPSGTTFNWRVDGVDQSETGPSIDFDVPEEGEVLVSVDSALSEDCRFEDRELVRACTCPEGLTLEVRDSTGATVTGCATPGDYVVRASGEDVTADNTTWNVDGVTVTDALEVPVTVTSSDGVDCGGGPMGPTVTATVDGDGDCPDRTASTLLNICGGSRFNPCCWLWRMLILFFAIVTMIGVALWLCPQVVSNLLIPQTAQLVPIAAVAGPIIAGIAGAITLFLFIIWIILCRPTWCNDFLVLLWQFLIGGGFVFVYFGACPTCGLLPLGAAMMLIGLGLFVIWVGRCRPTLCRIFFEIGTLGLVQVLVGWIEFVLVVCIWQWGWLLQAVFVTLLNFVGWIGTVLACQVNPNA